MKAQRSILLQTSTPSFLLKKLVLHYVGTISAWVPYEVQNPGNPGQLFTDMSMADVHTTCRSPGLVRDGFPYDRTTPWSEIWWVAAAELEVVPSSQRHGHLTTGATWPLGTSWPKCPQCKRAVMCRSPVKQPWLRTTWERSAAWQTGSPLRQHSETTYPLVN